MAMNKLRDQDRLDGASNFVIQKARILSVLDKHRIKGFTLRTVAILVNPADKERYEDAMEKAKCIIFDGVKDHVPHIAKKNTTKEMWDTLTTLYQGTSMQSKILLENQPQSYQMQKGEQIDLYLSRLQEIRDQLTSIGATPDQEFMVIIALNAVFEDWETFVQSILGRADLPGWEEMWEALRQEQIRRLTKVGSSSKGGQIKKEVEEDAALAFAGQQGKRKKKDISKGKCFHCGELVHYGTQCPKKKNKGDASDSQATLARVEKEVEIDDHCAMSAHAPLEKRWGDIELQLGGLRKMKGRILEVPKLLDHIRLWEPRMTVAG